MSCGPTAPSTSVVAVVSMVLVLIGLLYFKVSFTKPKLSDSVYG